MPSRNEIIDEHLQLIQEHRSNESNFDKLNNQLEQLLQNKELSSADSLVKALTEVKEKQAEEFRVMKEKQGSAWPEFEKFITQFERSLIEAKNT